MCVLVTGFQTLALPISLFGDRIVAHSASSYDGANDRVDHRRERRLGAIALTSGQAARSENAEDDVAVRMAAVRDKGLGLSGWGPVSQERRTRASFAGLDALSISGPADSRQIGRTHL